MSPDLCPACRKSGVIATLNGPTCKHGARPANAAWFPTWWSDHGAEARRIAFLELNQPAKHTKAAPG